MVPDYPVTLSLSHRPMAGEHGEGHASSVDFGEEKPGLGAGLRQSIDSDNELVFGWEITH